MTPPEPGVYPGVPADTYHSWQAVRCSQLKHFDRSPAHAQHSILFPDAASTAMNVGQAVHTAILEPEKFHKDFLVAPVINRRTNAGKAEWAAFEREVEEKQQTLLSDKDHEMAANVSGAVWRHPLAQEILQAASGHELSIVWDDPTTELRCKARFDFVSAAAGFSWVGDVKSTRDASPRGFGRQVAQLHYDLQAAMYLAGANVLMPNPDRRFCFLAIEKDPPFQVAVYELDEADLKIGVEKFRRWIGQWKACVDTGAWPGYGEGLMLPVVPKWNRYGYEEEF